MLSAECSRRGEVAGVKYKLYLVKGGPRRDPLAARWACTDGATRTVKAAAVTVPPRRVAGLRLNRGRPRHFAEWRALRGWGKLPPWEEEVAGYLLRLARENAGLTQAGLAERLGISQQAVAQGERWSANPTVEQIRRWGEACGLTLRMVLEPAS